MYSVQLEKSTTFSCAEWSVEAVASPVRPGRGYAAGGEPRGADRAEAGRAQQADRRASAPRPPAMLRATAARSGGGIVSYCSMGGALPKDRPEVRVGVGSEGGTGCRRC